MSGVVPDLEGLELVGEGAEAVLVGGCDETVEPNQVFRYMNLARAFAEIQLGAELYCLHKNRWWQTTRGPLLDAGAFVAGLEYATGVEAAVLGKPSAAYFAAALDALGAEPERTWLVGDDPESDIRGAQLFGMHTALVRTGKFRPDTLDGLDPRPRRRAQLRRRPPGVARDAVSIRIGTDLIEIERIRLALERPGFRDRCFTRGRAGVLRVAAQPARVVRGALLRQGGGRQGTRLRRPLHLEGDRDRRAAEAGRDAVRQDAPLGGARRDARDRRLADPFAHDGRGGLRRRPRLAHAAASAALMHEPLYSIDEMRAAEARYPGYPETAPELMERAGRAVADECIRTFPDARRFAVVCGGGSNGGDGRVAAGFLRQAGRDATETDDPAGADVVVDALFGTGFHGAPRPEAAATIERINAAGLPVVSVDVPSGVDASTGEIAGAAIEADLTVTFHGAKVGLVVAPGRFHAGRVVVASIGLEHTPDGRRAGDGRRPRTRAETRSAGLEVHGGEPARRRRLARARPARQSSPRLRPCAPTPAT